MALQVREIIQLQGLQGLRLISGEGGLDRIVCSAGIADYEFAAGVEYHNDKAFEKESFVISSLLFAQNDSNRILDALKELNRAGVSAFAYKSIIYQQLPQEVIDYSNANELPIFTFGQDLYFENVIFEIMDAVQRDDTQLLSEDRIRLMIENQMSGEEVLRISKSISLLFKPYARAVYIKESNKDDRLDAARILRSYYLNKRLKQKCLLCRYRKGLFAILTSSYEQTDKFEVILKELMDSLSIEDEEVCLCRSNVHKSYEELDRCFRESYHTYTAGVIDNVEYSGYDDIGAFQYLVPLKDNGVLNQYADNLLAPLRDKEEFLYTVLTFIAHNGDIAATAADCNCHQNTVRYRLTKVRELIRAEDKTELEFYAQLSTAVRIYLLRKAML